MRPRYLVHQPLKVSFPMRSHRFPSAPRFFPSKNACVPRTTGWLVAALLAGIAPAQAQFSGPGAPAVVTDLGSVLKHPLDDQRVSLTGRLVRQLSSDKYLFTDGSKQIRVEIDRELMPASSFGPEVWIVIEGDVEKDFLESPEIDVDRLVLKP